MEEVDSLLQPSPVRHLASTRLDTPAQSLPATRTEQQAASPQLLLDSVLRSGGYSTDWLVGSDERRRGGSSCQTSAELLSSPSLALTHHGGEINAAEQRTGVSGSPGSPFALAGDTGEPALLQSPASPLLTALVSAEDEAAGRHAWLSSASPSSLRASPGSQHPLDQASLAAAMRLSATHDSSKMHGTLLPQQQLQQQQQEAKAKATTPEAAAGAAGSEHSKEMKGAACRSPFLTRSISGIDLGLDPCAASATWLYHAGSATAAEEPEEGADGVGGTTPGLYRVVAERRPRALSLAGMLSPGASEPPPLGELGSPPHDAGGGGALPAATLGSAATVAAAQSLQGRRAPAPAPCLLASSLEAAEHGLPRCAAVCRPKPVAAAAGVFGRALSWISGKLRSHPIELTPSEAGTACASPRSDASATPHLCSPLRSPTRRWPTSSPSPRARQQLEARGAGRAGACWPALAAAAAASAAAPSSTTTGLALLLDSASPTRAARPGAAANGTPQQSPRSSFHSPVCSPLASSTAASVYASPGACSLAGGACSVEERSEEAVHSPAASACSATRSPRPAAAAGWLSAEGGGTPQGGQPQRAAAELGRRRLSHWFSSSSKVVISMEAGGTRAC